MIRRVGPLCLLVAAAALLACASAASAADEPADLINADTVGSSGWLSPLYVDEAASLALLEESAAADSELLDGAPAGAASPKAKAKAKKSTKAKTPVKAPAKAKAPKAAKAKAKAPAPAKAKRASAKTTATKTKASKTASKAKVAKPTKAAKKNVAVAKTAKAAKPAKAAKAAKASKAKAAKSTKPAAAKLSKAPATAVATPTQSASAKLSVAENKAKQQRFRSLHPKRSSANVMSELVTFSQNRARIVALNARLGTPANPTPFRSVGPFSNLAPKDFKKRFLNTKRPSQRKRKAALPAPRKKAVKNDKAEAKKTRRAAKTNRKPRKGIKANKSNKKVAKKAAKAPAKAAKKPAKATKKVSMLEVAGELDAQVDSESESGADSDADAEADMDADADADAELDGESDEATSRAELLAFFESDAWTEGSWAASNEEAPDSLAEMRSEQQPTRSDGGRVGFGGQGAGKGGTRGGQGGGSVEKGGTRGGQGGGSAEKGGTRGGEGGGSAEKGGTRGGEGGESAKKGGTRGGEGGESAEKGGTRGGEGGDSAEKGGTRGGEGDDNALPVNSGPAPLPAGFRARPTTRDDIVNSLRSAGASSQQISRAFAEMREPATLEMGEIENQGECGSCWAQTASSSVSLQHARFFDQELPVIPSVQQILDCVRTNNSGGCDGGTPMDALDYMNTHPVSTWDDYPPRADGLAGQCRADAPVYSRNLRSWGWAPAVPVCEDSNPTCAGQQLQELALIDLILEGASVPILYVDARNWQMYAGGLFDTQLCSSTLEAGNHVVELVGFNFDKGAGVPYWIIRNTWGEQWGYYGMIELPFGVNACGLANWAIMPTPPPESARQSSKDIRSGGEATPAFDATPMQQQTQAQRTGATVGGQTGQAAHDAAVREHFQSESARKAGAPSPSPSAPSSGGIVLQTDDIIQSIVGQPDSYKYNTLSGRWFTPGKGWGYDRPPGAPKEMGGAGGVGSTAQRDFYAQQLQKGR